MKKIIFALAVAFLTGGFAHAQSGDPVQGSWTNYISGMGSSTWTFSPLGGNRYSAQESGLGTARGTAVLTGNQMRIDFAWNGGAGYYLLTLNGGTATGTIAHTRGPTAGRTWNVTMRRASTPALIWRESESSSTVTYYGTWTWDAARRQFVARWNNNAQAVLTIVSDNGRRVVLRRYDPTGASASMTAVYVGQRFGNTIRGTVTWYYEGGKNTGTWSASW